MPRTTVGRERNWEFALELGRGGGGGGGRECPITVIIARARIIARGEGSGRSPPLGVSCSGDDRGVDELGFEMGCKLVDGRQQARGPFRAPSTKQSTRMFGG